MIPLLPLGHDCSPAAALRSIGHRPFALPFDWVQSSIESFRLAIADSFRAYHSSLRPNRTHTRVIDAYGFEFPHDYPITSNGEPIVVEEIVHQAGEGIILECHGKQLAENWSDLTVCVLEKYQRRQERFHSILQSGGPVLVLTRYTTPDVLVLYGLLCNYAPLCRVYVLNSSNEPFDNGRIMNIYTEQHGIWNEGAVWQEGITQMTARIS